MLVALIIGLVLAFIAVFIFSPNSVLLGVLVGLPLCFLLMYCIAKIPRRLKRN